MYELFAVALTAAAHQTAPLIRSAPSPLASYGRGTRVVALDEGWTRESGIIADGASKPLLAHLPLIPAMLGYHLLL